MKNVDSELTDSDGRGHNVNDGIRSADLMEVDFVDRNPVNFCFGLRQAGEDFAADGFDFRAEFAPLDQLADLFPRARRLIFRADDLELRGADRMNMLFYDFEFELERRNLPQVGTELMER